MQIEESANEKKEKKRDGTDRMRDRKSNARNLAVNTP
jgi:hypothetical protein